MNMSALEKRLTLLVIFGLCFAIASAKENAAPNKPAKVLTTAAKGNGTGTAQKAPAATSNGNAQKVPPAPLKVSNIPSKENETAIKKKELKSPSIPKENAAPNKPPKVLSTAAKGNGTGTAQKAPAVTSNGNAQKVPPAPLKVSNIPSKQNETAIKKKEIDKLITNITTVLRSNILKELEVDGKEGPKYTKEEANEILKDLSLKTVAKETGKIKTLAKLKGYPPKTATKILEDSLASGEINNGYEGIVKDHINHESAKSLVHADTKMVSDFIKMILMNY